MTRHLIYYCYPAGDWVWRANLAELFRRLDLFDGVRVAVVAADDGEVRFMDREPHTPDPPYEAVKAFTDHGFHVEVMPNHRAWGEAGVLPGEPGPFPKLVGRALEYRGPGDVTFYAHAKGVTYPSPSHPAHAWARILYSANLDFWPLVEAQFRRGRGVVGSMRQSEGRGAFVFSGNFFWFSNAAVAAKKYWHRCPRRYGGVELWPGRLFRHSESGCVFKDYKSGLQAYDPVWMADLEREFGEWAAANAAYRNREGSADDGLRVHDHPGRADLPAPVDQPLPQVL